jgi:hypothetical protein
MHTAIVRALLDPTPERRRELYDSLVARFELWVRQFQGWRRGDNDYQKNVIGFTRWLRGMLIAYEMLRRDGALSNEEIGRLNAYFVFAARRIMDEGRWPHSRTTLHPDHPESSRDFYEYGGEHKPDRLFWTNCLPNFQSDPLCALAHLSALFPDHPDAPAWRRKALDDLDGQLDAYCGKSGAWEESINYALYTFSYFVITFRALKQKLGIDYFNDERVRRYAAWLVRFFGPRDKRFGAWTWPAIGNAVVPQNQADYLLCYAAELPEADPLREQCLAVYQLCEPDCRPGEHFPTMVAAMAPIPGRPYTLEPVDSEHMDELGVAMRHASRTPSESYLFQKIGFWKDHYENDESAFNWYAKGTPFCMEYGTYTGDAAAGGAHNLVEIPDMDGLRRGYLADHLFTPALDYTRCEMPVTLKLLWGRVRSFEEVDDKDGKIDRTKTPYFYIGDDNPVGPKTWKVRMLFFVKPDYLALFDRVYGDVPHRYNLHFTGGSLRREGQIIRGDGRFELDLECLVQRPSQFEMETGELVPNLNRPGRDPEEMLKHAQRYFRVHNHTDGIYRTLLFARERGRNVQLRPFGQHGMQVVTSEYTDYIFLHNEPIRDGDGGVLFAGRAGWIRRDAHGRVQAILADGDELRAFGVVLKGRGPWTYNLDGTGAIDIKSGPPRPVSTV